MPHRVARILLLAVGCLALAFAACGEDGDPPAATRSTGEAPAISAEPTATTGSTPTSELPVVQFIRDDGSSVRLPIEVPSRDQYGIGLSGRHSLEGRGMLFYYAKPGRTSFWMKNTHIDLSIAFVGADARILEIREMTAESLDSITPASEYQYAIEAPAGWYEQNDVEVGDHAHLAFEIPEELTKG